MLRRCADSQSALQQLSEKCGGHPLLLNLSASWLERTNDWRLDEGDLSFFEKLFQQDFGDPEAQVEEIFKLLLARLPETVKRVLLDVSVYRLPFDLMQAQAMVPEIAQVDLEGLEAQGFLLVQESQWRLHPLMNQLVADALVEEAGEERAHRKAIEYFEAQLQAEETNIQDYLECFHHYCECRDFETAYDTIDHCFDWLYLQGWYRISVSLYEILFIAWQDNQAQQQEGEKEKFSWTLTRLGDAYQSLGEYGKAIEYQQQSLEIKREIGDRNGEAISLLNLGLAYAKIDEHWKSRDHFEWAKALFTTLKLAHIVEKCEQTIQERNRIIAGISKKAPSLPTKKTEPDWWEKSKPTAARGRDEAARKQSLPSWLFYLAIAAVVVLIVITLQ